MDLGLLVVLVVILTTLWVTIDASANRVPVDSKPYSLNNGALAWFFSCALLWIVTFPYYWVKRSQVLSQRRRLPTQNVAYARMSTPKLCIHCGKYYEGDPNFCPNCGQSTKQNEQERS